MNYNFKFELLEAAKLGRGQEEIVFSRSLASHQSSQSFEHP